MVGRFVGPQPLLGFRSVSGARPGPVTVPSMKGSGERFRLLQIGRLLMLPGVRIAVVIPAGPRDDVLDTLASVVRYSDVSRSIVVVDDGSELSRSPERLKQFPEDVAIIKAPIGAVGGQGGLWVKLSAGYRWILERYEPQLILRLDADAVLLGSGLEAAAEKLFSERPDVGLLGSYRIGPDGKRRDFAPVARQLRGEMGLRGLRHPRCRSTLRRFFRLALAHGYVPGESVLGGAYIHNLEAARCLYEKGWLDQPQLAGSKLGEDHIMTMITKAAGYGVGDFGNPEGPMALKWRGLPADPHELLATGKLVTHSVRSWRQLTEQQIRNIFADARNKD
jgi:hypothetical protein